MQFFNIVDLLSQLPGCGKTELAVGIANESGSHYFIAVQSSDIKGEYVRESELKLRLLFQVAREKEPCILL